MATVERYSFKGSGRLYKCWDCKKKHNGESSKVYWCQECYWCYSHLERKKW